MEMSKGRVLTSSLETKSDWTRSIDGKVPKGERHSTPRMNGVGPVYLSRRQRDSFSSSKPVNRTQSIRKKERWTVSLRVTKVHKQLEVGEE